LISCSSENKTAAEKFFSGSRCLNCNQQFTSEPERQTYFFPAAGLRMRLVNAFSSEYTQSSSSIDVSLPDSLNAYDAWTQQDRLNLSGLRRPLISPASL
jgi:hypothetical protein